MDLTRYLWTLGYQMPLLLLLYQLLLGSRLHLMFPDWLWNILRSAKRI